MTYMYTYKITFGSVLSCLRQIFNQHLLLGTGQWQTNYIMLLLCRESRRMCLHWILMSRILPIMESPSEIWRGLMTSASLTMKQRNVSSTNWRSLAHKEHSRTRCVCSIIDIGKFTCMNAVAGVDDVTNFGGFLTRKLPKNTHCTNEEEKVHVHCLHQECSLSVQILHVHVVMVFISPRKRV